MAMVSPHRCLKNLTKHSSGAFVPGRSSHDLFFTITHYAGDVTYQTKAFLEKNRDSLSKDVTAVLQESKCHLISRLFKASNDNTVGSSNTTLAATLCV